MIESQLRTADNVDALQVLAGGGEMGALMRSIDWARTPVGPVAGWPQALRTTVGLLLRNRFPMLLWWGPQFVQFYNDAYRPIPGDKHPRSMAQPASECWREIWDVIGPMVQAPFSGGPATSSDDLTLLVNRKGFLEETHFKVAYSPVPDATIPSTGIGGVLATVAETTEQVYAARQLKTLRELGARAAEAKTPDEACRTAATTFLENPFDVPFALLYLIAPDGKSARLASSCGFASESSPANPSFIDLATVGGIAPALRGGTMSGPEHGTWPVARIIETRAVEVLTELDARLGRLPSGHWSEAPRGAVCLPLASPEQPRPYGVLIAGCSPHRALDEGYRTFFELAAAQVVTAVRNANAYEEQRLRAEKLAEINRAKTVFFSNVSHEFRTPLTLMLGPTEDLLAGAHGELSSAQRAQLELLRRNELRLQRLVNALLEFSRIEAGRLQALYEPTDLAALTRELASSFQAAIEKAGLKFTVDCEPLQEPIFVDHDMWERIVLNLLSNAFKFTFEGEIEVSLNLADGFAVLQVNDTGVGVRPEDVPRLFERFHRVEGTRARTHEGSGIGLALVHELVRLHGGSIRAHSRYGEGTAFTVMIPAGSAHLPQDRIGVARERTPPSTATGPALFAEEALRWLPEGAEPHGPQAGQDTEVTDSQRARVLIADDNADMRAYVRRILEQEWIVEAVGDGEAALAAAQARKPDLVLTDVMMPVLDGFGLLRELRANPETAAIPVIMLSARAGDEARVEGLHAGAEDYLVKPFAARELLARVRTHLELARLRGEVRTQLGEQAAGRLRAEKAQRRLAKSEADLREAIALRDEFLRMASHELRTPLMTIGLHADGLLRALARGTSGDGEGQRVLEKAQKLRTQADRMEQLIDGMLDVFSLGRGGIELKREKVDLADVAAIVIERLRKESRQANAAIDLRTEPSIGSWDRARLEQILSHLVANALKFGAGQPVDVIVGGSTESARVLVRDRGIGIAAEDQERIFDRFVRAVPSSHYGGFGLGLWLVRELVSTMDGSIRVESQPGAGATFIVDLPRQS